MSKATNDEAKIEEIRALTEQIAGLDQQIAKRKARIYELIRQVFPEKRGEPAVRGRLNEVVKATGLTREYVARIRDGKVPAVPSVTQPIGSEAWVAEKMAGDADTTEEN